MTCGVFRLDLRHRIGHGEHDGVARHPLEIPDAENTRHRESDEDVGAFQRVGETALHLARVRRAGHPPLHEIHPLRPLLIDGAELVYTDDVADPAGQQDFDRRRPGRADPGDHDAELLEVFLDDPQRVEERRQHHDRGAVLIVVEHRDVQLLAQPVLDLEAAGGRDVLEVDAAEPRSQVLDRLDDLVRFLGGQADGEGVDAGELFEEHRLAFHHRHRRLRPDVAEPQDGRAVGDDRDGVLLHRQGERALTIFFDGQADPCDPGGVRHREVVARTNGHLALDLDLAAKVHEKRAVGDVDDPQARRLLQAIHDLHAVHAVAGVDRDVADDAVAAGLDQVHRADVATGVADRHGDAAEHPRTVLDRHPDGKAIAGARRNRGHSSLLPLRPEPSQLAADRRREPDGGEPMLLSGPAMHFSVVRL